MSIYKFDWDRSDQSEREMFGVMWNASGSAIFLRLYGEYTLPVFEPVLLANAKVDFNDVEVGHIFFIICWGIKWPSLPCNITHAARHKSVRAPQYGYGSGHQEVARATGRSEREYHKRLLVENEILHQIMWPKAIFRR